VDRVLTNESSLARVSGALGANVPTANDDPTAGQNVWTDGPSTGVADADKASDSAALDLAAYQGDENAKTGIFALDNADLFNILCIPPDTPGGDVLDGVYAAALPYCVTRRALLLVDAPSGWKGASDITANNNKKLTDLKLTGDMARNAALFFPRVTEPDPARNGQLDTYVPCGIIAGLFARTDSARGVWKAPAGIDAALNGVDGLRVTLTDKENGLLNPLGINCLRTFPVFGTVVWGSRTLRGADQAADEYKYIPVRRTALYIEESLYRGLKWAVFEPNDEPLWAQIRLNVGAFMHNLFRQGAFQGTSPRDAYFVKCDKETTTQNDIDLGIVNVVVGFAPLRPAEFVIIQIQQMAGQIQA
jgi:phage tail sheath protein FI